MIVFVNRNQSYVNSKIAIDMYQVYKSAADLEQSLKSITVPTMPNTTKCDNKDFILNSFVT